MKIKGKIPMSMNLVFAVKEGGMIDFPFQTSTKLTLAVMAEPDNKKRLDIIRDDCNKCGWDQEDINKHMKTIKTLMNNPNLTLTYI
jgi:hypothetical protein